MKVKEMARIQDDRKRFAKKLALVVASLDAGHKAYLDSETFGGPSLHFHLTSLAAVKDGDFDRFAEHVYALLSAWGMHRMGPGGSKMTDFKPFKDSLLNVRPAADRLLNKKPEALGSAGWRDLEEVFRGIRCMASASSLVGNSKLMAHWLPNLVPPIDRTYTLKLLYGRTSIKNGLDNEWAMLREMLEGFFYPLLREPKFKTRVSRWLVGGSQCTWDTSPLKIADNVVIGFIKSDPKRRKE